nr:hypothetical protein Iba_scaffold57768CG0010 [Ipomoea batatas]GME17224.1 hypothetical protein Iba_scaffold18403CG0880 [Ipomoea batatas]
MLPFVGKSITMFHYPKPFYFLRCSARYTPRYQCPPIADNLVHSINKVFFLVAHVYEFPLHAAYLYTIGATLVIAHL